MTGSFSQNKLKKSFVLFGKCTFVLLACASLLLTACGGGGGGGGASGGANDASAPWGGTKTLKIDINGLLGQGRASSRPNLDWKQIDLKVYLNDEVVYDESIASGNNDDIIIKNVKVGSSAHATAAVWVNGEEASRTAVSDTITVTAGANKLTLYVPYRVTYDLNGNDLNQAWDDGSGDQKVVTSTTRGMKAPEPVIPSEFDNWTFAGWNTQSDGSGEVFIPGKTTGDVTVYAQYTEGEINYTQEYYDNHPSGIYMVKNATQLMQIAELSRTSGNDFAGRTVQLTADISLDSSFMGIGMRGTNGSLDYKFNGTIDGQLHTVTLAIDSDEKAVGFVNWLDGSGTVKNLYIKGSVMGGSNSLYVGGVVAVNDGTVTRCAIKEDISVTAYGGNGCCVGGIVGSNDGTIDKAYITTGSVSVQTGGSAGYEVCIGGICGENCDTLRNAYNAGGIVTAQTYTYAGGILGLFNVFDDASVKLTCCHTLNSLKPSGGDDTTIKNPMCGFSAYNVADPTWVPSACFCDSQIPDAFNVNGYLGPLSNASNRTELINTGDGWVQQGDTCVLNFTLP